MLAGRPPLLFIHTDFINNWTHRNSDRSTCIVAHISINLTARTPTLCVDSFRFKRTRLLLTAANSSGTVRFHQGSTHTPSRICVTLLNIIQLKRDRTPGLPRRLCTYVCVQYLQGRVRKKRLYHVHHTYHSTPYHVYITIRQDNSSKGKGPI